MGNYRVIGARRDNGHAVDEPIIADSPDHAARRANDLGILVSRVEPILDTPTSVFRSPSPPPHRPSGAWRGVVRALATISATILLIPGVALFLYTVLMLIFINSGSGQTQLSPGARVAASAFVGVMGVVWSILAMLGGALLFLLLYIEDHLHRLAATRAVG